MLATTRFGRRAARLSPEAEPLLAGSPSNGVGVKGAARRGLKLRRLISLLLLGLVTLLAACSKPESRSGESEVGFPSHRRADLINLEPVRWISVHVAADHRTVVITYVGGPESCFALDHWDIAYEPAVVLVTIFGGLVPQPKSRHVVHTCVDEALLEPLSIHLSEPLNGRHVQNGAGNLGTPTS